MDSVLTLPGSGEVLTYSYPNGGSTTTFVPIQDQIGSTVALVDAAGNLAEQFSYEPYGKVTASGQATGYPYLFAGMEQADALSGLYRTFARYYNPHLQRFLSEDPLGFTAGDANFFGYAGDNPVSGSDPLGECALGDCAGGDNGSAGSGGDSNGGGFFLELFESFYSQLADLFGGGGGGHPYIRGQGFKAHTINRNTGIPSDIAMRQTSAEVLGIYDSQDVIGVRYTFLLPPGVDAGNFDPTFLAPVPLGMAEGEGERLLMSRPARRAEQRLVRQLARDLGLDPRIDGDWLHDMLQEAKKNGIEGYRNLREWLSDHL